MFTLAARVLAKVVNTVSGDAVQTYLPAPPAGAGPNKESIGTMKLYINDKETAICSHCADNMPS
jgi:hypothetical protein